MKEYPLSAADLEDQFQITPWVVQYWTSMLQFATGPSPFHYTWPVEKLMQGVLRTAFGRVA